MMENSEWVEGTGLGLSIVKAIIEGYGGYVWVESELGVGSTFGCVLPALE
jgi:signal transduction histidine kinase